MTQARTTIQPPSPDWAHRIDHLLKEITAWATAEGWQINDNQYARTGAKTLEDATPALSVTLPVGELHINPIAEGRIDVEALPTLNRVKLLSNFKGGWTIMTDSNVPLRVLWNQAAFAQLARDLLA